MNRAFAAVAFAALAAAPLGADAQSPKPAPTPAIKDTQHRIAAAKKQQLHAQAAPKKTAAQKVGAGGAHPDSEVPNNPGETSSKPGAGPGYGAGNPKP